MELWLLIKESLPILLKAALITIEVSLISMFFAIIIGLVGGLFRISSNSFLKWIASIYVNTIRGTPLLVQILFIYFGIPKAFDVSISAFAASIVAMSVYTGAYLIEIFRAGIESIDKGQVEAARSLGMTSIKAMRLIILPQAIQRMIPAFVNQFTTLIKDTSLLSVIGIHELTMEGQLIYSANFRTFEILIMVGVIYFVIVYVLTRFSNWIEKRMRV